MRSHKLDRVITIQTKTTSQNEYGDVTEGWADVATVHAQRLEARTSDFLRAESEGTEALRVYRIRWRPYLALDDRVIEGGSEFNIKSIVELGRREGLELRCEGHT